MAKKEFIAIGHGYEDEAGFYYPPTVLEIGVDEIDGASIITSTTVNGDNTISCYDLMAAVLSVWFVRASMEKLLHIAEAEMAKTAYRRVVELGGEFVIRQYKLDEIEDRGIAKKYADLFSFSGFSTYLGKMGWNIFTTDVIGILASIRLKYIPVAPEMYDLLFDENGQLHSSVWFREWLNKKYNQAQIEPFKIRFSKDELKDRENQYDFSFLKDRS